MKISIITQDQLMIVNKSAINVPFEVPAGEWAIHFDDNLGMGEVEYIDSRKNETIKDFSKYDYLLAAYNAEKTRLEVIEEKEAEAQALLDSEPKKV